MWQYPDGTSEDDDNQDVLYALETLQSLRERQRGLEQELVAVWQAHQQYQQLQQQYAQLAAQQQSRAASRYPGSVVTNWEDASSHAEAFSEYSSYATGSTRSNLPQQGASSVVAHSHKAASYSDVKEAATALVTALARAGALYSKQQQPSAVGALRKLVKGPASVSSNSLAIRAAAGTGSSNSLASLARSASAGNTFAAVAALQQMEQLVLVCDRQTLIWWAQEQLQGALDAITASRVVLNLLRNEAGLLKVRQRDSMGVSLTVDTIDWELSKGSNVIVQGELQVRCRLDMLLGCRAGLGRHDSNNANNATGV